MRARRGAWLGLLALLASFCSLPVLGETRPTLLSPSAGESLAPGSIVEVRWASLCGLDSPSSLGNLDEAELVLSLDGGVTFPIRVSQELSPCDTRFLWRVPVLSTGRARLGIRMGREGLGATESIAIVSAEFRILPDLDGRVQALYRRAAEWWTPEPAILTAEDLLDRALSPARGQISKTGPPLDVAAPPERVVVERASHAVADVTRTQAEAPEAAPAVSRLASSAIPLRL
jgi:hypothetical protein